VDVVVSDVSVGKLCAKCGVNPMRGCRSIMGVTFCERCWDHGGWESISDSVEHYVALGNGKIMDDIEGQTLKEYGST